MSATPPVQGTHSGAAPRALLWPRFLLLGLVCAGLVAFFVLGGASGLTFESILQSRARWAEFTQAHLLWSVLAFMGVYAGAVMLSIPGAVFLTITGGFLFGGWLGASATTIAATTGATGLFLIARGSLGEILGRRSGPWLDRLREGFAEDAASYMLFLRLVPVFPFAVINLAAALLGAPLKTFVWTTFLGIIPATFAYSLAGAGLDSVIAAQKQVYDSCVAAGGAACKLDISPSNLVTRELILAFAAIGTVALIPVAIKKWRARRGEIPANGGAKP